MAHGEWCLRHGERLNSNEYLRSKNGLFYAVVQSDANFVIYRGDWWEAQENTAMWSLFSSDGGASKQYLRKNRFEVPGSFHALMYDGLFYLGTPTGNQSYWSTMQGGGHKDLWAVMQDDGNFCIKLNGDINASQVWGTCVTDSLNPNTLELTEMVYDFKNAIVKQNAWPKQSASNTAINKVEINQSATLIISYTYTLAKGWKTSTTLKIGARTSIKVGVPLIADGKVELSTELTQGFEWNETTTKSETKTINLPVVVPPGKGVIGQVMEHEHDYCSL